MSFTLQIVQGGSTLANLVDGTNYATTSFKPGLQTEAGMVRSAWTGDILGSSINTTIANLNTLQQILLSASDNRDRSLSNRQYTPIFLQLQIPNASGTVQTELFADDKCLKNFDKLLETPILGNIIEEAQIDWLHRPYYEETSLTTLFTTSGISNNGADLSWAAASIKGDLPAPLYIQSRADSTGRDRIHVALRSPIGGTISNFVFGYEAEGYSARGANVANLSDANLSPGGAGVTGQRYTPTGTAEQLLVAIDLSTNQSDQLGQFRVLVRCRDNNATANFTIRAKPAILLSGTYIYGDWGDAKKSVPAVGGTTALPLVDCGIVSIPALDAVGNVTAAPSIHIYVQALTAASSFDIDKIFLLPCYEGGNRSGIVIATYPVAAGNGAAPDMAVDSNDRLPSAYLVDGSNALTLPAQDLRGQRLFAFPNRAARLFLMTSVSSGLHTWAVTNSVTVKVRPRYRIGRGS